MTRNLPDDWMMSCMSVSAILSTSASASNNWSNFLAMELLSADVGLKREDVRGKLAWHRITGFSTKSFKKSKFHQIKVSIRNFYISFRFFYFHYHTIFSRMISFVLITFGWYILRFALITLNYFSELTCFLVF